MKSKGPEAQYLLPILPTDCIMIADSEGEACNVIKFLQDEPGILVFDCNGALRCKLKLGSDGTPEVSVFDARAGEAVSRLLVLDEA